jgi:hypothetical protein
MYEMYENICVVCKTAIKGHYLTLIDNSTPLSLSQADIDSFGVTNLAFECGNEGCETAVCYRCLAKLERIKKGGFLSKREHLICPKCQEPFGEGGAHFLVDGRFPDNVNTVRVGVRVSGILSDREKWVFQWGAEDGMVLAHNLKIPTSVCSVCLSDAELNTIRVPDPNTTLGAQHAESRKFPLCKSCYSILAHPSVKFPGTPYIFPLHQSTPLDKAGSGVAFVNPDYMDLVKQMNSHLNWQK